MDDYLQRDEGIATSAKNPCEMAEETFKWILAAETPDNFRKWFLELFQVSGVVSFLF